MTLLWFIQMTLVNKLATLNDFCYELVEEYYTRMYKETDTKSTVHGTVTSTSKGSSITIDSDYQLFVKG